MSDEVTLSISVYPTGGGWWSWSISRNGKGWGSDRASSKEAAAEMALAYAGAAFDASTT